MAVQGIVVSVGTTATRLDSATETDTQPGAGSPRGDGQRVTVSNTSGVTVYVGGADVTTSGGTKGFSCAAGGVLSEVLKPGDALYGIVATGTASVDVLRVGV